MVREILQFVSPNQQNGPYSLGQLLQRAAEVWEVSLDDIELVDGAFRHSSDPVLQMSFAELASKLPDTGGPVVGRANLDPRGPGSAFATHIVDVEVDPETGKVEILRYTAAQDAGKAIHPDYVEGQIQGGVVQGIGWALNEEYFMNDEGAMVNSRSGLLWAAALSDGSISGFANAAGPKRLIL